MDQLEELDWSHRVVDIREMRTFERAADPSECDLISRIFGEAVCRSMSTRYKIEPLAPGRYRVVGSVDARLELICGVTLDPMEQLVSEPFDVEFQAAGRREAALELEIDAFGEDEPELVEQGEIRFGRFVCEVVASAIDPFPRSEDATLDRSEAVEERSSTNPFAQLSQLKENPTSD